MRKLKRLISGALACSLAAVVLPVALASGASAAGACQGISNYHAGYRTAGGQTNIADYGTQAQISTRPANVCTASFFASRSRQYVALTSGDANRSQFLEAGYIRVADGPAYPVYYVSGYVSGQNHNYLDYQEPGPAYGSTHIYTVQYNASMGVEVAGYDYTALISITIPFGSGVWTNRAHEYAAGTDNETTDIPGSAGATVTTSQLKVQQPFHVCCDAISQNLSLRLPTQARYNVTGIAFNAFNTND